MKNTSLRVNMCIFYISNWVWSQEWSFHRSPQIT